MSKGIKPGPPLAELWTKVTGKEDQNLGPLCPGQNGEIQGKTGVNLSSSWDLCSGPQRSTGLDHRAVENVKNFPRAVKSVFYVVVRGLNEFDRENGGSYSPLNGAIAAEVAWSEYDRNRRSA